MGGGGARGGFGKRPYFFTFFFLNPSLRKVLGPENLSFDLCPKSQFRVGAMILFSTDVASMGLNSSDLCIGVSLG